MNTTTLTQLLQIAGVLHLGLICAGLSMPFVVDMRTHLKTLPQFIRRLFWVYYAFIALSLVSFGIGTFAFAETLAEGGSLARGVCIFLAAFWTLRLIAATFVFDVREYLTNRFWWLGYQATNIAFIYLPVVYLIAAWKGGAE